MLRSQKHDSWLRFADLLERMSPILSMADNIQPPPPAHLPPPSPNPQTPESEFIVIDYVTHNTSRNGTVLQETKHWLQENKQWLLPMALGAFGAISAEVLAHKDAQAQEKAERKDD
ncbi:hypothetical protein BFJ69_g10835 [Fusarium oxysporum]|uniref:Uncharacterized protein n=1 Tax=Fusarium oxysporum TaxID=5507 RepID=A0A420MU96_FUSOX|nr:hypothetical protein BFJ69_g10835 [Fusarium oxysporum]